jgi:probable addiction module antidote protein
MRTVDISETSLIDDLKNPEFAAAYLEEVLRECSIPSFLLAVKNVVIANGGIKKVAKNSKRGRESMYKSLSQSGNPRFSTVNSILSEVGLQLSIVPISKRKTAA